MTVVMLRIDAYLIHDSSLGSLVANLDGDGLEAVGTRISSTPVLQKGREMPVSWRLVQILSLKCDILGHSKRQSTKIRGQHSIPQAQETGNDVRNRRVGHTDHKHP